MKYNDVLSYGSSEGMCGSGIEVAGLDDAQWKQIVSFLWNALAYKNPYDMMECVRMLEHRRAK